MHSVALYALIIVFSLVFVLGLVLDLLSYIQRVEKTEDFDTPRYGAGFLFCFFLGIVGLILGIAIFPPKTNSRRTFMNAWAITFVSLMIVSALPLLVLIFLHII